MSSSNEQLLWAIKNGDIVAVKEVAGKSSFNANAELLNGRNPLHYASDYGQTEVIEYLIVMGADVNAPDKHGITPLLAAIFEGHANCVELLLTKGAKKTGKAPDGSSYIDAAEDDKIKALLK
ncbi:myotrophin-like [Halichondria panicea]|uniref:myotrophin-like n=1 Tax=Halichondria panicea TaxID=6063 RepID=UPI00312BC40C